MSRTLGGLLLLAVLAAGCTASGTPADDGPDLPGAAGSQADRSPAPGVPPTGDPAAQPPAGLESFYAQAAGWEPCRGSFECATVTVPLDYADPSGDTIDLALLRAPATDPALRQGSLLVNPGGPGVSGVDYAERADSIVGPDVRRAYDVVGFDPRGVGQSSPVACLTDDDLDESLNEGDATPDTPAEVAEALEGLEEYAASCQEEAGDLLPHVGTDDVARDLDIIRSVLGEETLTYLGKSYGTLIGAEYARHFPTRVGRLVLDGPMDPTLTWPELVLEQTAGMGTALTRFADACVETGCSLGATRQEVLAVVDDVLAAADEAPIPTQTRPLTQILAFNGILAPLYYPPEQGFPALEAALDEAADGDGSALLALADLLLQRSPDGEFAGTARKGGFISVTCLDFPHDGTVADVEAAMPDFRRASPQFGELRAWSLLACTDWPAESDRERGAVRAAGAPPILVVAARYDGVTPYEWALGLSEQLASGVLLTFDSTQHLSYREGNDCVDGAVDAYLLEGTVPSEGTRCT